MLLIRSLIAAAPGAFRAPAARSGPLTTFFGGSVGAAQARAGVAASSPAPTVPAAIRVVVRLTVRMVVIGSPGRGRPNRGRDGGGWGVGWWCARSRGRSGRVAAVAGAAPAGRTVGSSRAQ